MSKIAGTKTKQKSSVGAEIIAALHEVVDALQEGEPLERRFTVRRYHLKVTPRSYRPDDVRRVRESLNLSQPLFAQFLGASLAAVRSWEQGRRPPSPIVERNRVTTRHLAAAVMRSCTRMILLTAAAISGVSPGASAASRGVVACSLSSQSRNSPTVK